MDWIRRRKWWTSNYYFYLFPRHLLITLMWNWSKSTVNYFNFTLARCQFERMAEEEECFSHAREFQSESIQIIVLWIILFLYPAIFIYETDEAIIINYHFILIIRSTRVEWKKLSLSFSLSSPLSRSLFFFFLSIYLINILIFYVLSLYSFLLDEHKQIFCIHT